MELGTINLADNIGALGCVLLVPHSNFLSLRYSEDIFAVHHNTHHPGCKPDASEPKALVKQVIICSNSGRFWAAATRWLGAISGHLQHDTSTIWPMGKVLDHQAILGDLCNIFNQMLAISGSCTSSMVKTKTSAMLLLYTTNEVSLMYFCPRQYKPGRMLQPEKWWQCII